MSPFELVFAVFGLLLGLVVAEVLGGFSRALKLRRSAKRVRIGWLTPLLGLFVILDLTSFWEVAYLARDQLSANYPTLVAVLAVVGTYYLAATQIFPDDPALWPDFDAYYDRNNRIVLGGMLAANVGIGFGQMALDILSPRTVETLKDAADGATALGEFAILILLISLMIVKSRRVNVGLLAVLIVLLLVTSSLHAFV